MLIKEDNVKKKLKEEFEQLRKDYPLVKFSQIELHIYDVNDYFKAFGTPSDQEDSHDALEAFLTERATESKVDFAIILIINENFPLDRTLLKIMASGSIQKEHLVYWLLYHEYGHLVHLHNTYERHGYKGLLEEKEGMDEELERLFNQLNSAKITKQKFDDLYRTLWFEKFADDFANITYQKRKTILKEIE